MSALQARLIRFAADPGRDLVLDPDAISEAAELLAAASDLRADATTVAAVAILHFLRWTAGDEEWEELQVAAMLSAPLLDHHPDMLPEVVRRFLSAERKKKPKADGNPAKAALRGFLTARQPGTAAWAGLLWQLSLVLYGRYQRDGQAPVLAEAVAVLRHAVAATPPDDPGYLARLASLGAWLVALYQETGRPDDVREALPILRSVLAGMGGGRAVHWQPSVLSLAGSALHDLFVVTGDLDALGGAIKAHREVMDGTPAGDARHARVALSLAGDLLRHYQRTGEIASLNDAISCLKKAAGSHAGDDPSVRLALSNSLAIALRARHERTRDQTDLGEAIAQGRRALAEAVTSPARGAAHATLGAALLAQARRLMNVPFDVTGTAFLDEALSHLREAATLRSAEDPRHAAALSNLGSALLLARDITGNPEMAAEAAAVLGAAADSGPAPASVRIQAGAVAGRLAADRGDWPAAARRLATAVGLLEQAVPRALRRDDREHQLRRLRDLASDAAACAWRNGDAERAAALFEQGRGVLLAQAMDLPTEVERLAARDEERALRFTELRRRLDELGGDDPVGDADGRTTAEERIELAGELVRLMAQIRGLKGFERFLMPLQTADLVAASGEGPVALINVSRYGSAAFVIRPDGVAAVDLPDLSPPVVRAMAAELLTVTDSGNPAEPMDQAEQNRRLTHLLGWLWDAITGPVLGRLGLDAALAGSGPRMWWCPSGLLSFLPLHAAGHHGTRSEAVPRTVMDRVVSSYVPTVRVLVHARRAPARASGRTAIGRTLVVAPGTMGVPGTADEAAMVGDLAAAEVIGGAAATPKAVLAALGEYGRVHFACHALSDLDDPSAGYLELHDQQRLAVSEVAGRRLEAAELAFLSACSTYRGGPALADEAVHLGSAFQMAGYRHVIATLWPALDTPPTVRITRKVYQGITGPAGAAAAASALHQATRYERDRAPGAPSMWAAHVHSGP